MNEKGALKDGTRLVNFHCFLAKHFQESLELRLQLANYIKNWIESN